MAYFKWAAGIAFCIGSILLLSCGQSAEEAAVEKAIEKESGGKAKADISKDKMVIKTEEGQMTIDASGGAEIPADFPEDVFVYKGAAVIMSMSQPDGFVLSLSTADGVDKVKAAYGESMASNGWKEETNFQMGAQSMISYKKGGRIASVMLVEDQGKTNINLTVNAQ
jgi:hypothetical protein